jgi:hypothetical protein
MIPPKEFYGDIRLSINAEPIYNANLTSEVLSMETRVSEVTIRPDSTVTGGSKFINVISLFEGVTDTLSLMAEVITVLPSPSINYAKSIKDAFVEWLEINHPEFGITTEQEWFIYNKGVLLVGGAEYTLLNDTWDMTVKWYSFPDFPYPQEILFRPRGKIDPVFAARRDDATTFYEIPVEDFK